MNGYTETQMFVIRQIQAERRAAAAAHRAAAEGRRGAAARGRDQDTMPGPRRLTAPLGALRPIARP